MASVEQRALERLVVMGGGTGIQPLLEGVKTRCRDVTAIVTVADDGGSSGRLRKDYHIHPPGDVRNCLVALSQADELRRELFRYRFEDSILRGHSFGNLLIAVLNRLTGSFQEAIEEARRLLAVEGQVLPSTDTRVVLVAQHPDGSKSTGEQSISRSGKPIVDMELRPAPGAISDRIRELVANAQLVVLGPGSLFTSIMPNLLVPGMTEALAETPAKVVLIGNLMTQPGETDGFTLPDHVKALFEIGGLQRLDALLASDDELPQDVVERYRRSGAHRVAVPGVGAWLHGAELRTGPMMKLAPSGKIRHDGERLVDLLLSLLDDPEPEREQA
jgi:uncharacterized cofD-like protein